MQTLKERLSRYCTEHDKPMPYDRNLLVLGKTVIDHLRNQGKADMVQKTISVEQFEVNHYPDEALPFVDDIISRYFENPTQFMRTALAAHKKEKIFEDKRTFRYAVELHRCAAFERACEKLSLDFIKGEPIEKTNAVYYILPYKSPPTYVNLGILFQKLRTNEKYGDLFEEKKAKAKTEAPAPKSKRIKKESK